MDLSNTKISKDLSTPPPLMSSPLITIYDQRLSEDSQSSTDVPIFPTNNNLSPIHTLTSPKPNNTIHQLSLPSGYDTTRSQLSGDRGVKTHNQHELPNIVHTPYINSYYTDNFTHPTFNLPTNNNPGSIVPTIDLTDIKYSDQQPRRYPLNHHTVTASGASNYEPPQLINISPPPQLQLHVSQPNSNSQNMKIPKHNTHHSTPLQLNSTPPQGSMIVGTHQLNGEGSTTATTSTRTRRSQHHYRSPRYTQSEHKSWGKKYIYISLTKTSYLTHEL